MNIPRLYNKQTGREVPHAEGVVESAAAVGRYEATTNYEEVAKFFSRLVDFAASRAELRRDLTEGDYVVKGKMDGIVLNRKPIEDRVKEFIQLLSGNVCRNIALREMLDQLKISAHGLEVRLQGDDNYYFIDKRTYRLNRGEQVVLYSEFLPGGLVDTPEARALSTQPEKKEDEKEKRIGVVGLQVVDERGIVFSDVLNPDTNVFSEEPMNPSGQIEYIALAGPLKGSK